MMNASNPSSDDDVMPITTTDPAPAVLEGPEAVEDDGLVEGIASVFAALHAAEAEAAALSGTEPPGKGETGELPLTPAFASATWAETPDDAPRAPAPEVHFSGASEADADAGLADDALTFRLLNELDRLWHRAA